MEQLTIESARERIKAHIRAASTPGLPIDHFIYIDPEGQWHNVDEMDADQLARALRVIGKPPGRVPSG